MTITATTAADEAISDLADDAIEYLTKRENVVNYCHEYADDYDISAVVMAFYDWLHENHEIVEKNARYVLEQNDADVPNPAAAVAAEVWDENGVEDAWIEILEANDYTRITDPLERLIPQMIDAVAAIRDTNRTDLENGHWENEEALDRVYSTSPMEPVIEPGERGYGDVPNLFFSFSQPMLTGSVYCELITAGEDGYYNGEALLSFVYDGEDTDDLLATLVRKVRGDD